jgi:RNA-directed DNA polymerase
VISPLLSNIYLHVLDRVWEGRCAQLGTLVRYADDFVVMCRTKEAVEEARRRVGIVLVHLGLELQETKTRTVDLSEGREGFDFLGCHLRKRLSGPIWERSRKRVYFLHRWPSRRAMKRVRARVRELTPRSRCHQDLHAVIAALNPVLRGWGQYFRTGNASRQFLTLDRYVVERLRGLLRKRHNLPHPSGRWHAEFFHDLGLHRLRGTIQYPGVA